MLRNFYLNKLWDVEINFLAKNVKDNEFELIYNINANEKFFDNIELEILDDFNEENFVKVFKYFENLKGKPYSINKISKIIKLIEEIALSEQFASIRIETVEDIIADKINLKFKIRETENFMLKR